MANHSQWSLDADHPLALSYLLREYRNLTAAGRDVAAVLMTEQWRHGFGCNWFRYDFVDAATADAMMAVPQHTGFLRVRLVGQP